MTRLRGIIWKEFVQLRRDPMALTLTLFIPVAMLFIFGYAINTDVKHLPTVVLDQSRDVEAQKLLEAFANSQYFDLTYYARSHGEVTRLIDTGRAKVGIVIPPDFAARLRGRGG
ncbi:MAG TPA: ABC transporter permease, partial [Methylomirabilota bacterium]|nr:ABC transporter permease [Methylomirabilota bacterium]